MITALDIVQKIAEAFSRINTIEAYYYYLESAFNEQPFFEYVDEETQTYSYTDIFQKITAITAYLEEKFIGIEAGSWVGLKAFNHPHWYSTMMAILKLGYNVLLIDNKAPADFCSYVMTQAGARGIVTTNPVSFETISIDFKELIAIPNIKAKNSSHLFADKIALCTSGTTGDPKVFVFQGKQFISQIRTLITVATRTSMLDMLFNPDNNKVSLFLPFHHTFALGVLFAYSTVGADIVLAKQEALSSFSATIKKTGVQAAFSVPLVWESTLRLIKGKYKAVNEEIVRELFGDKLRFGICGGAKADIEMIRTYNECNICFAEGFGMTETGILTMNMSTTPDSRANGSVGNAKNAFYKMMVRGEDGAINEEGYGELLVSGDGLYSATLQSRQELLRENEYIETGDIVEITEGDAFVRGRIKDIIINASGENIYPEQIERHFASLAEVGIHYTVLGIDEQPVLVAVLPDGLDVDGTQNQIIKLNQQLPLNQRVASVVYSSFPLPLTTSMKVRKSYLCEQIVTGEEGFRSIPILQLVQKFQDINLISKTDLKIDIKTFFAEYLDLDIDDITDDSLIIENLGANSMIIAESFVYLQDKYDVTLSEEFFLGEPINILDVTTIVHNAILEQKRVC